MAEEKKETQMIDPIAYRSDYNPDDILTDWKNDANIPGVGPQNANLNYQEYGDDSNPAQQGQKGGLNPKYEGEGVMNTYIDYNPDLKTSDLDPNYMYGENARQQNAQESGYIARRNDNIASALYNEGLTSRGDVANYLNSQNGFTNSTEADRENTIESIYKRLGQIQPTEELQPDLSKADEIVQDTSGKIYGKTTADSGNPEEGINTLADANSVFKATQEDQVRAIEEFMSLDIDAVATCVAQGINGGWTDQTWRDVQKYYPERIDAINQRVKEIRTQNAVNNISNGSTDYVTSEVDAKKSSISSNVDNMASQYSNSEVESDSIRADIENSVAKNQSAGEASKTMENIESEVARLKNRLKNLRQEANSVFKGDAPDYLVNAYINNKTQEINNQLSILEDRYNAAYSRYTNEVNNEWKQKEFDLKREQLDLQIQQQGFNQWYQKQTLAKSNIYTDSNGTTWELKTGQDGTLYYEKVEKINNYSGSGMKGKGLKNNNPGNIKDNEFGNVIGHDESGFAIFATPEDGFDALVEKIIYNQTNPNSRYYGKTIREYFRIYAPSSDGNNPDAYANSVAKQLGVSVDTPISELDPVLFAKEIAKHDSGYNYDTYGQFRGGGVTDTTGGKTFTDRDYKNFEKFMNPDTSASDKKVIAQQYGYGDDLEGMTKFANNALDNKNKKVDLTDIEIPYDIFDIVDENGVGRTVSPDSDEGKELIKKYVANYIIENGLIDPDNTSYNNGPISSDGITPELYRQRIYNLVPAGLKNGDQERENLYDIARTFYQAGYTADQAALAFYGVDVKSDKTGLMQTLVDIARASGTKLPDEFYGNMGSFTERGLSDYAVNLTENSVLPEKVRLDIADYTQILDKIQNVKAVLDGLEGKTGVIKGKITNTKNKFESDEEYQQAMSAIQVAFSQLRNELLGSQITEQEAQYYDKIFPDENDNIENIRISIEQTENGLMKDINRLRVAWGLPMLVSVDQALDPYLRAELYKKNKTSL